MPTAGFPWKWLHILRKNFSNSIAGTAVSDRFVSAPGAQVLAFPIYHPTLRLMEAATSPSAHRSLAVFLVSAATLLNQPSVSGQKTSSLATSPFGRQMRTEEASSLHEKSYIPASVDVGIND